MLEKKDIKLIKVLQVNEFDKCNYLYYIFEDKDNYYSYIQNKNYGVLMLVYGVPKEQQTLEEFMNCYNLDEFIQEYQEEYEDEE